MTTPPIPDPPTPSTLVSPAWWTSLITFLVFLCVGVLFTVHHPVSGDTQAAINAVVPGVAYLAATVSSVVLALVSHATTRATAAMRYDAWLRATHGASYGGLRSSI